MMNPIDDLNTAKWDPLMNGESSQEVALNLIDMTEINKRRHYGMADIHTTLGMGIKESPSNMNGY